MKQDVEPVREAVKARQILDGARIAFLALGFDGTSVDEIARRACVSKPTVYAHFADKRALFVAVVEEDCREYARRMIQADAPAEREPIRDTLRRVAGLYTAFSLSPFSLGVFRLVVADALRFPELGQAFHNAGPRLARTRLTALLAAAVARGELAIDDLELAADQFTELCKAGLFTRRLLLATRPSPHELTRAVDGAVSMFLCAYATRA